MAAPLDWILTAWNIHLLYQQFPDVAAILNTPSSYGRGNALITKNPILDGFATTPIVGYRSYADFSADVTAGAIPAWCKWVLYDNESWGNTPQPEQDDPWTYMARFGALAHAHGLKAAMTPARDLGNVTTSVNPKRSGETLDAWYIRTNIVDAAAQAGDIIEVQSQVNTTNLAAFQDIMAKGKAQALAANPAVSFYGGLSTNYGTADQMATAAKSVSVDGFYVTVTRAAIPQLAEFLGQMRS